MSIKRRDFLKVFAGTVVGALTPLATPGTRDFYRLMLARFDNRLYRVALHYDIERQHVHPLWIKRGQVILRGLRKQGYVDLRELSFNKPGNTDIVIIMLWTQPKVIEDARKRNVPFLVVERGAFANREDYLFLGWNGYNGRSIFAPPPKDDNGHRWERHFGGLLKPWREKKDGYTLVMGQRKDVDLEMRGINIDRWAQDVTDKLVARGEKVMFRPHPHVRKIANNDPERMNVPKNAFLTQGSLEDDLAGARYCVTFCSNVAADSVLAGVPAVAMDEGSIAWPVTTHDLDSALVLPDRSEWCNNLAWRHWTLDEVNRGIAWAHISKVMPVPV